MDMHRLPETADLSCVPPPATAIVDFDDPVGLDGVIAIATGQARVELGPEVRRRLARSAGFLDRLVAERRCVYGVTTGFGPLAAVQIAPELGPEVQRRLVYHLASGVGAPLSRIRTRAVMACRLAALARGHSGIGAEAVELLAACLNHDLLPPVPKKGTVGASGDLTPLAHMTLTLMGEGDALLRGLRMPAAAALAQVGLEPLRFARREALALVNGTSAMAGIAAVNAVQARRAVDLSHLSVLLYAELLGGRRTAWHPGLGRVRPHPGQVLSHRRLWSLSGDSGRLAPHADLPPPIAEDTGGLAAGRPLPQDAYTLRCAPQILGAVLDVLDFHDRTVAIEIDAVTDNPVFLPEEEAVLHGGNFQGQPVAFASDALTTAVLRLADYAERRIARLTDAAQNGGLGPFLTGGRPGLDSGFMGAQVTATALVAEMRGKAGPASIHSLPTNANNQDVVSLGTVAARKTGDLLEDTFRVLAIEALALAQGHDLACRAAPGPADPPFASRSRALVQRVRRYAPFLAEDRPLSAEIETLAAALRDGAFDDLIDTCPEEDL